MIYLDNNATTKPAPEVLAAMLPYYTEHWGNPSSLYPFGNQLGKAQDTARAQVATLIGATRPAEITFTGGGTEANHMAIRGVLLAQPDKRHIITSLVEHSSILNICRQLETQGYSVTYLPVVGNGQVSASALEAAIRPDTALVSIMWANNETGILSPITPVAEVCTRRNIVLHSDGVQAVGKISIDIDRSGVHLLSLASHKIHGPKGVGALYIRRGTQWISPVPGMQEHGRRAGTENVPGIVGLGMAAQLASDYLKQGASQVETLRNQMESQLVKAIPDCSVNGTGQRRVGNTCNINIRGVDGEVCVMMLAEKGICVSTGSACSAGRIAASHVITALGVDMTHYAPLRISLSRYSTQADVDALLKTLPEVVHRLRQLNPST